MIKVELKDHFEFGKNTIIMIMIIGVATGVSLLFSSFGFPETNIVIVYLLSVMMSARFTRGRIYGILASIIATGTFNYFFTEPYYTLSVDDPSYLITFSVLTITALITSTLTFKVKQSAEEAKEKELEASALFKLTNRLTDALDIADIASISTQMISDIMGCKAACLCFDEMGQPENSFVQQLDSTHQVRRKTDQSEDLKHHIVGLRSAFDRGNEFYDWPIYGREGILGLIRIPKENASVLKEPQMRLLRSMIESTALAMDRSHSAQARIKSREETVQERYRGNILRAISHDLRTPLSGIMGISEMLMDMTPFEDERYVLLEGIYQDANWLHTLVENILSLTRLQDGKLVIEKQLEPVEEVLGGAVNHMMKRYPEHEITVEVPKELLLVPMDARLIEQVLINLLDNAVKHTPVNQEIKVTVSTDPSRSNTIFKISDRGTGISTVDMPHIFRMFFTTSTRGIDAQRGVGLGLAICDAIISAHGGTIEGHNRVDGVGAEFIFKLPLEGDHGFK